jgi:uncharacterized tellurite resistance protein B-like protein
MNEEYVKFLSTEEKYIFVKIFCRMVKADSRIASEELEFLKSMALKFGIDNASLVNIVKTAGTIDCIDEAKKISKRTVALELIKELCVLANIDEDLGDGELDIIIDIARSMNVEDEKVLLINRWVLDNIVLAKAGHIILEKDNG